MEVEKGWLKGLGRIEILSASRVVARTQGVYIYTHIHTCTRVRERKRCARAEGESSARRVQGR